MGTAGPLATLLQTHDLNVVGLTRGRRGWFYLVVGNGGDAFVQRALAGAAHEGHPVDHLTREVAQACCAVLSTLGVAATARFPFDATAMDFRALASWAGLGTQGRLGILMHPQFGPWWALRFALELEDDASVRHALDRALVDTGVSDASAVSGHPCLGCSSAPCSAACPASAVAEGAASLSETGQFEPAFRLLRCVDHVRNGGCADLCAARAACPLGPAYGADAHRHHHRFFRAACWGRRLS